MASPIVTAPAKASEAPKPQLPKEPPRALASPRSAAVPQTIASRPRTQAPRIEAAEPLDGYVLRLRFSDGSTRDVDLEADLCGPVFEPLRDLAVFRQVEVDQELRTIVWPNGADMDPDVLRGVKPPA